MPKEFRLSNRQRKQILTAISALIALCVFYWGPPPTSSESTARVTNVVDGDTFDVVQNGETIRIRLIGVNTPETVDPRKPVECFGKEASERAKELLMNKTVLLSGDATQGVQDKYGRSLRYVQLPDGTDAGFALISDGFAYEYTYDAPYERQMAYKKAEAAAREHGRGLWQDDACTD